MQNIGQNAARLPRQTSLATSPITEQEGIRRQSNFRLAVGWLAMVMWIIASWSLDWDVDWHSIVGRDGFWTPPHLVFYSTIAATGVICAGVTVLETFLYHRQYPGYNDRTTTPVLRVFHGPVGFMLAGFGMVVMLISAPLDDYWHRIYGIDVKVWAPFHVMLLMGIILANLGLVYLFASEFTRRQQLEVAKNKPAATTFAGRMINEIKDLFRPATLGVTVAMVFLATRYILAFGPDTFARGTLTVGNLHLASYSLFLALVPALLVALVMLTGRVGTATLAGLLFLAYRLITGPLIQWGVEYLVVDQGRSLRSGQNSETVIWVYPLFLPLAGLAIDLIFWLTRTWRQAQPTLARQLGVATGASVTGAVILFLLDKPWDLINNLIRQFIMASGNAAAATQIESRLFKPDYWATLPLVAVLGGLAGLIGWAWAVSMRYTER